jgi:amino acid adenylation domain-containing protein
MSKSENHIALVGLSCRFPGANNAAAFWSLLAQGVDAVSEIPESRWALGGNHSVDRSTPANGRSWAGLINQIAEFDAEFFNISPHEARLMDPQQRLLLELAWEAIESAGIPRELLAGSRTGVFMGISAFDYSRICAGVSDLPINAHSATGNALSIAANRISYFLDLRGPSLAVDTACSSSLVAVHLAVESLIRWECDIALAGGVNVILDPTVSALLAEAGMLATDGHCKTFDARADGYVRGEGCGVVVLKRLSEALRDNDPLIAIICGSAANQDGRSNGLTAPNGRAQEALVRAAIQAAHITAQEIDYVEAHGTGTPLGDPIELLALDQVLGQGRNPATPCLIGSVKSNIGHLEAAAGIAGLIKVALALKHKRIPPSLHFREPNPGIPFERLALRVVTELSDWPQQKNPILAGVSSFGFGGTNAHVILQEPPDQRQPPALSDELAIVTASAHNELALQQRVRDLQTCIGELRKDREKLVDVGYTSTARRSHLNHRFACVVRDWDVLEEALKAAATGREHASIHWGLREPGGPPTLAFVYSGQGSHYRQMGRQLYHGISIFRETIDQCDAAARNCGANSIVDELGYAGEQEIDNTASYTQPAQTAFQIALTALWRLWGLQPEAVIGHSLGEVAAAYAAEILTLEEAMRLVVLREAAARERRGCGAMLSINLPQSEVVSLLRPNPEISIAAVNAPALTVVSAEPEAIHRLTQELVEAGLDFRRVNTDCAFHSPQLESAKAELKRSLAWLKPRKGNTPFFSTLLARRVDGVELTPEYWGRQLREPVQFAAAVESLARQGQTSFLELGGHPVLGTALHACLEPGGSASRVFSSLQRGTDERKKLLQTLAGLYCEGRSIEWRAVYPADRRCLELPSFPWQHKVFWVSTSTEVVSDERNAQREQKDESITESWLDDPNRSAVGKRHDGAALSEANDRESILQELRESVAKILGGLPQDIDMQAPFVEMGADSILLAQAAQRIQTHYGVQIRLRQFFEELSNLDRLADYLVQHAAAPRRSQPVPSLQAPSERVAGANPNPPLVDARTDPGLHALFDRQLDLLSQVMRQQLEVLGGRGNLPRLPASSETIRKPSVAPVERLPGSSREFGPYRPPKTASKNKAPSALTPRQQAHLDQLIARYTARTPTSKTLCERWRASYADCRASAGFRPSIKEMLYPIQGARADGARLWDVDGNAYLDISMDFGVNIFGHKAPFIETALREQIDRGLALSMRAAHAGEAAALLCELTGMDRAVFCQSGTEAVMTAARLARLATGRSRIAFFTNAYHGHFDGFLAISRGETANLGVLPAAPGIAPEMVANALVLPYGADSSLKILREQAASLAAVLVEPIQSRHPELQPAPFLYELRRLTRDAGIVLIFDEMITGFRTHPGGAQAWFELKADLATYGKVLGGGQPIAAVAGRRELLDGIDGGSWRFGDDSYPEAETTFFAGTFSGNPLALASARAVLQEIKRRGPQFQRDLNAKTDRLAQNLNQWFATEEVPIRLVHFGSLFRFAYEGNLDLLFYHLLDKGVFVWEGRNCFLSAAHEDADLDFLQTCVKESVDALRAGGFLAERSSPPTELTAKSPPESVEPAQRVDIPMTEAQRQLWVLVHLDELASQAYTEKLVIRGHGRLDVELLKRAFEAVVQRHECLRTTFSEDGRHQVIHERFPAEIHIVDASQLQGEELERMRVQFMKELAGKTFDLSRGPLVRMGVFRLTSESQLIAITGHHIILDGWSLNLFINDLAIFYSAYLGQPTPAMAPAVQYREYVAWLEERLRDSSMCTHEAFWKQRLEGALPRLELPHDQPKLANWTWSGARTGTRVSESLRRRLSSLGRIHGATLFMTLLAAYQTFLHRLSEQDDLIVGCPVLGRSMANGFKVMGYLTHILPIRSRLRVQESFVAFLRRVRSDILDAFEHQEYPFAQLIRKLDRSWNPGEPALVRVTFNLDRPREGPRFEGFRCEILGPEVRAAKFELSLNVLDLRGGELLLEFDYNRDLFSPQFAASLREGFVSWLRKVTDAPETPLGSLALNPEKISGPVAQTAFSGKLAVNAETIQGAFDQQALQRPDTVCVFGAQFGVASLAMPQLTYRELRARANAVATQLQALGVGPDSIVGLATQRGIERVIGSLGILKAGGAYLPLETEYPLDRLAFMLRDSGVNIVVCEAGCSEVFEKLPYKIVILDGSLAHEASPNVLVSAQNLAYVMFTSGSTGAPKGVCVTHRNVLTFINGMVAQNYAPNGPMLHHSPFSFDASTLEIWWPLLTGTLLVVAPPERLTLAELARCAQAYDVQDVFLTNELFNRMVDHESEALAGVRRIMAGGSAASATHFGRLLARKKEGVLLNAYGPTECTTFTTLHHAQPEEGYGGRIPIGTPLSTLCVYVLDRNLQPVPPNVPGELYVSGEQVARGYYNRPGLTAERFLPDPFSPESGIRMYRTGDRVRRRENGSLEFLGRVDGQVKLSGFRIELSEVEIALRRHPDVRNAAVKVWEVGRGDQRLTAYVVAGNRAVEGKELRAFLSKELPAYMIPRHFVSLTEIPMDSNGKPDHAGLPAPDLKNDASADDASPETPTEKKLAMLWERLLKCDRTSRSANFFELGGHSLLAAELVAEIARDFSVYLSLRDILENPTLGGCARVLESKRDLEGSTSPIPRVSRSERRMPRRELNRQPGSRVGDDAEKLS